MRLEPQTKIMRNRREPLIGQLDIAISHSVNFALLQKRVPLCRSFIEHGGLYLTILSIHQIDIEKTSLPFDVGPPLDGILLDDFNFYDPVLHESIQAFYWQVFVIRLIHFLW